MTGMTGNVPYYGGRMSPAQAYAASHARPAQQQRPPPQPAPPPPPPRRAVPLGDTLKALDHLLESGVIDQAEYDRLRARATP